MNFIKSLGSNYLSLRTETMMKLVDTIGDLKIIYAFGSESLADTVSNIYLTRGRVTNEELQEQFYSLSNRLLEGMPEKRWPEFLRRVRRNVGVMIEEDRRIQKENWEMMREYLKSTTK